MVLRACIFRQTPGALAGRFQARNVNVAVWAICALIKELHASGHVARESVANRLQCFVGADGSPILEIEQMAQSIRLADFTYSVRTPPSFGVINGGKASAGLKRENP